VFGKSITTSFCCNAEYNNYANLFFQIAFHPKFSSSRVEKERRAILSELQMMNTIEYRVDCQASELFTPSSVLCFTNMGLCLRRDILITPGNSC
jgi:hypothetical protein